VSHRWMGCSIEDLHRLSQVLTGALATERKILHICATTKELLLVLLFHEPLYFRHLHTIRFPRGEGV
jgi:hypothetical protein